MRLPALGLCHTVPLVLMPTSPAPLPSRSHRDVLGSGKQDVADRGPLFLHIVSTPEHPQGDVPPRGAPYPLCPSYWALVRALAELALHPESS